MVQLTVTQSDIIHCDEANDRKQGKESAHLVSWRRIPQYPSVAEHLSFQGYLYTWPEKKSNGLWKEAGRKEKKRRGKGRGLLSEPQIPPTAHFWQVEGLCPRYSKGKTENKNSHCILLFLPAPLCSAPQGRPCQVGNGRLLWVLRTEAGAWPWRSEARTQEDSARRKRTGNRRAPKSHYGGKPAPHGVGVTRCSQNKPLKTGAHKTQNVCSVKDTKKSQVSVLKQIYKANSVSPHVTVQFLQCSGCQTH